MDNFQAPNQAQVATFHLSETMVFALRECYRLFEGDISMALVLGEVGQHVVYSRHSAAKQQTGLREIRRTNAYSIAAASGIPRETVRRKLEKLIARSWIVELPDGGLSLNQELATPLYLEFMDYHRELLARMRQTVKMLEGIEI